MLEGYEGLSGSPSLENHDRLSDCQLSYIEEVLPFHNDNLLAERIDELNDCHPPKAIDSDKYVAMLIESVKEEISPLYLEAPQDGIQIEEISDMMTSIEGLEYSEWKDLSYEERMEVLQKVECKIAEIAHRPVCHVSLKSLGEGHYGYYTPGTNNMVVNGDVIVSNSFCDYKETLDTLIHEGRHAYQDYNLNEREVHPRSGDVSNWKLNEEHYEYQDVAHYGFKAYALQPVEADARAFAEDILKKYFNKIA
ncbi:MAG: DUF3920 family protein [Bacteroidaceae bacterium]|nr:DUF3920 family protein [Bacteroidaceae bacterium]